MSNLFSRKLKTIVVVAILLCFALISAAAQTCSGYYALAFDDGPNSNTNTLLGILNSAGVKATFFPIGNNIAGNMSAFQAMVNAGHSIQNHSYTHSHMTSWSYQQVYDDLNQAQQAVQNAGGGTPTLFRPPYLEVNSTIQSVCSALGLTIVTCDVDVQDWNGASTSQIISTANNIQNGGVFLMHDGYSSTNNAIQSIVDNLLARGLCAGAINNSGTAVAWDGGTTPAPTTPPVEPTPSPVANGNIVVRAQGTMGGEILEVRVDGNVVGSWTMTTSYQDYYANGTGSIEVHFTNDDQLENGMDIQVDYIIYNNTTYQAEDQATNTAVYVDGACGGSYSEWLHCDGYILFDTGSVTPEPTAITTAVPGNLGDVDSNGSISIIDALLVAQYYVDLNPDNFNPAVADTDCDGDIDIIDALLIAQYYVNLITGFC